MSLYPIIESIHPGVIKYVLEEMSVDNARQGLEDLKKIPRSDLLDELMALYRCRAAAHATDVPEKEDWFSREMRKLMG